MICWRTILKALNDSVDELQRMNVFGKIVQTITIICTVSAISSDIETKHLPFSPNIEALYK